MSGVFIVVPLNTRPLNVSSTDKRICFALDSVLCVSYENDVIIGSVTDIHKGHLKQHFLNVTVYGLTLSC